MNKFINDMIQKQRREFQSLCQNRSVPSAIMNGVVEHRNIPYLADTDPAHTLDVFFPADQGGTLPVVINVHGGGLVMGNKEFNRYFCANLCKQGFLVFSIEYRLAPEVTVFRQLDDVAASVDYVDLVCGQYGGRAGEVFMVGDSAGAFLILYTAAIQRNRKLANVMSVMPAKLPIEKIALISGMFYTTKPDSIGLFLSESLYGKDYRKKPFYPYLDPGHIDVFITPTANRKFLRLYREIQFDSTISCGQRNQKLLPFQRMGAVCADTGLGSISIIITPSIGSLVCLNAIAGTVKDLQHWRFLGSGFGCSVAAESIYLIRFIARRATDLSGTLARCHTKNQYDSE